MRTAPNSGRASLSGDDSFRPEDERALLERARGLIPRLAERASAATAARQLPAETIAEYHAADDGSLSEQMNRNTGFMQSAPDLTWSYASLLSALEQRSR